MTEPTLRDIANELQQQVWSLNLKVAELTEWKRQQLIVSADFQAIGRELGVGLGEPVWDKILPAIQKLKSDLAETRNQLLAERSAQ